MLVAWGLMAITAHVLTWSLYLTYIKVLKITLDNETQNPRGIKYNVSTIDGATIGEVDEIAYLKAKFEADTFLWTKAMTVLNCFWIAWVFWSRL